MVHSVCHHPLLKPKRILVATGGTGGHLFPAVALAQELVETAPGVQICFAGGGLVGSPFLMPSAGPWGVVPIEAPKICFKQAWKLPKSLWRGYRESQQLLEEFAPEIIVGFGSYHTLPILLAAQRLGIPYVLHEGNAVPGRVNRLFASKALCTAVHFASAADRLNGKVHQVAMPLRRQFQTPISTEEARQQLGLAADLPTLLVIGGSQGAQALNRLLDESAPHLARLPAFQVIHLTGPQHHAEAASLSARYADLGLPACVKPFEDRMELAWRAADLCVARSGASSLAEQMACAVPGILVPFPAATDDHQTRNALSFADQVGGAIVIPQHKLSADRFVSTLKELLESGGHTLAELKQSMVQKQKLCTLRPLSQLVLEVTGWSQS